MSVKTSRSTGPSSDARSAIRSRAAADVNDERLAVLGKAIGHPARLRILRLLGARTTCVTGDLAPELGLAPSTVSEHLRILRDAGLIKTESADGRPCYCLDEEGLGLLLAGVNSL